MKATAGAGVTSVGGGRNTGDKSPNRGKKIVNRHTWPVCEKVARPIGGEEEPTQNGAVGLGCQPTKVNAEDRYEGGV